MSNIDEDTLKKVEELEEILVEAQQVFKRQKPMELADRINTSARLQKGLILLTSMRGTPTKVTKDLIFDAPAQPEASSIPQAIDARDLLSGEIRASLKKHEDLKKVLGNAIPGKDVDRNIISINASPQPNKKIQNLFTNNFEYIELVFCTNTEAFVVSRSEGGIYSISAAKYWKVPELTPNSPVQK